MIRLTKLNRAAVALNADLIKFVEASPDTVITLITGEKLIVCETTEEIIGKVIAFRKSLGPEGSIQATVLSNEVMQECCDSTQNLLES